MSHILLKLGTAAMLLMLVFGSATTSAAQVPSAISARDNANFSAHTPKGQLIPNYPVPEWGANAPQPDAYLKTVALRASLSPDQLQAVSATIERHQSEFDAISKQLPDSTIQLAPSQATGLNRASVADAQKQQRIQATAASFKNVQKRLEQDLATTLSPDQLAQYQAGLAPAQKALDAAEEVQAADAIAPQYNSSSCDVAGRYASLGRIYAYSGYAYAYNNYVAFGTSNGSAAYYYLYYAQSYAWDGLVFSGGGIFDLLQLGGDANGFLTAAVGRHANATNYAYYGSVYAYADYTNTGRSNAYNAYYYASYANYYSNQAYGYSYGCRYG